MSFRGLFIGIDRYHSDRIRQLNFARRDAVAMHALFSDTLGDGATLLVDEKATKENIERELDTFVTSNEDDVVIIYFSGHGSKTHELVTYDADRNDLSSTAISLDTLLDWFKQIPSTRLVCILDCCFSGGMGAKVLQTDTTPRDLSSTLDILDQLSGKGRIILTASGSTEPAWEHGKIGHGLLTYYLLEALQGAEEVRQAGKVSVYRLLEYVSQRVRSDAAHLGKNQHPSLRATMDDITWPLFVPGKQYLAAFPERNHVYITKDVYSLEGYGFPRSLIDAWAGSISSFNQLQLDAINEYNLLMGEHLVVSAPTSSGKTLVGELAALKGCLDGRRTFFLLPLKALVNDKHQQFNRMYGGFGIKTIRATGEITDEIPELILGRYNICLMTYEKFYALVLAFPHLLEQVGTVVIDEVQMIGDETRGANLEFILTLLRMRQRDGIEPQLIALSAVIGDTNGLEHWLGARLLRRTERPVPLNEGILCANGTFRYLDPNGVEQNSPSYIQKLWGSGEKQEWIIPLVAKLVADGKQVIVFRNERGKARGCALYLARELNLPPAQDALNALPVGDLSRSSTDLRTALLGGVAFHNSNLDRDERLVVEEQFRTQNSSIRVIVATTTLAMGINTPAEAVIVAELTHPRSKKYTVAEYKNIVGRAGRLGYATQGTSFVLALNGNEEHNAWSHYVTKSPEDLFSRFLDRDTDPRSLIVRVLAATQRFTGDGLTAEDIIGFLEGSFGAFQQIQQTQGWQWDRHDVLQSLNDLSSHNLVELTSQGKYQLTPLGKLSGETGVEVETVIRFVEAFRLVDPIQIHEATIVAVTQLSIELDNVLFPMNWSSKYKEPSHWPSELRAHNVAEPIIQVMLRRVKEQSQGTLRCKKASACLLWMSDLSMTEMEQLLTRFGGGGDGAAGPIRSARSRTCDILPIAVRVAELLYPNFTFGDRTTTLLTRLEIGISGKAVELATVSGNRLTRADYLALVDAGLHTFEVIEASPDNAFDGCFEERNRAIKVAELRRAVQVHHERQTDEQPFISLIPPYDS